MIVKYGSQIGVKFSEQGKAKKYYGNTIVSKVEADNPAYHILEKLRYKYQDTSFEKTFIFLPSDSYHLTVMRGLNDQVRTEKFWPSNLDNNLNMIAVDEFIASCVKRVTPPLKMQLKFDKITFDDQDLRICFQPKNNGEKEIIKKYRDALAEKIGLKLPGHDEYGLHITLAYTWQIPNDEMKEKLKEFIIQSNIDILQYGDLMLQQPLMTYYDNMLKFYTQKIPRKR